MHYKRSCGCWHGRLDNYQIVKQVVNQIAFPYRLRVIEGYMATQNLIFVWINKLMQQPRFKRKTYNYE